MRIKNVSLTNFRGIENASFDLSDKLNLFVGVNGSGKSTVLDAIVISLSWLINRIQTESANGKPITESSIKLGESFSDIKVELEENNRSYQWNTVGTARGTEINVKSDYSGVTELALHFQQVFREHHTLPVIAYYPVNRVVGTSNTFSTLYARQSSFDVYNNAVGGKTNYQSFFEWFRTQEDIVNEEGRSYSKWLQRNEGWIKLRARKLFDFLYEGAQTDENESSFFVREIRERYLSDGERKIEPRYLFIDLLEGLESSRIKDVNTKDRHAFRELEFILNRIVNLADSESGRENLREGYSSKRISQILSEINEFIHQGKLLEIEELYSWLNWIWSAFNLGLLLNLWWLNEGSRKEIDQLFRELRPMKSSKAYAQQGIKIESFMDRLQKIVDGDDERYRNAAKNPGRELYYVSRTIEQFLPGYSDLHVKRYPKPHLLVEKDGETISLNQLSDGEKNLIALVGDIARRLTIANTGSEKPLDGEGIILIDEIDLHLHPGWQRLMIPNLTKLFPNCQFIITTHSPQVISHAKPEHIFLLKREEGHIVVTRPAESYGKNTDRILEDILGVDSRPTKEKELIDKLFVLIQNGNLTDAKTLIDELYQTIGEDPEISKAQSLLKRKEIIGK